MLFVEGTPFRRFEEWPKIKIKPKKIFYLTTILRKLQDIVCSSTVKALNKALFSIVVFLNTKAIQELLVSRLMKTQLSLNISCVKICDSVYLDTSLEIYTFMLAL